MIIVPAARSAEFKRMGWWGERTIDDLLVGHVAARPEAEALVDPLNLREIAGLEPQRLCWRDVEAGVRARAALLHANGLRKDDVVVIQLPNGAELTMTLLACFRLGIIASPAPAQYRLGELSGIARRVDAAAAITTARIGKHDHAATMLALRDEVPGVRHVFVAGAAPAGAIDLHRALADLTPDDFTAADAAIAAAAIVADDVATICWTSGTEAEPKGVPRSHNEWLIMGEGCVLAARLAAGTRMLNPFPMVNMAGLSTGLLTWLQTGGVLVQHHPFDLAVFLRQIREERIDYTIAAPAVLNALLDNAALAEGIDFTRLHRIGSGSAPLSEWMVRTFHERYGVEILNIFGSNEGASFVACLDDVPDPADRAICFPRLGDHGFTWRYGHADRVQTRLVDPETNALITEPGVPGELRLKGPSIFSGYWRAPEATARAFDADGWFRTGDLFAITGPGGRFYRFVGRHKDVIIRGGMNISAEEIEGHLLGHPAVREVAVIGYPDPILGERLCACVVSDDPGLSIESLNRYLVEEKRVAVFKQIERLERIDTLPRNPVGKVVKRVLRTQMFESAPA